MISKKIKYVDYNDNPVEKDFYFHLNTAELTKMNFTEENKTLTDIILEIGEDVTGTRRVLDLLEEIVRASVGRKSADGSRFVKNDDVRSELFDTEAYSVLFQELLENPEKTAEFIKGIMPRDAQKKVNKALKSDDITSLSREELMERIKNSQDD